MEKKRSLKCAVVFFIGASEKSTSTTMTRTDPLSGLRTAAADRTTLRGVPSGYSDPGRIMPSLNPVRFCGSITMRPPKFMSRASLSAWSSWTIRSRS